MTGSLRLRLLGLATLGIAITVGVAAIALVVSFQRHVERFAEHELQRMLGDVAAALRIDDEGHALVESRLPDPRYEQPYGGAYWQVSQRGVPELRSRSLWDIVLPSPAIPAANAPEAVVIDVPGIDGGLYTLTRTVSVPTDRGLTPLIVTTALDYRDLLQTRQSFSIDVAGALALIALVLLLWAVVQVQVGLRPVAEVERRIEGIRSGAERRLTGPFPVELQPLVTSLNDLIDHQGRLTVRARERAGSLAHALKTPLTGLSGLVGRLRATGRSQEARVLESHLDAMRVPLERELARAQIVGPIGLVGSSFDASQAIDRLLMLMQHLPRSESLTWNCDVPAGTMLTMDPADFSEIIGNLLDNARKWARSEVSIRCVERPDRIEMVVEDDGPGIPADLRPHCLARGERGTMDGEGSGLGLAIVRDVLEEYGAPFAIEDRPVSGCRIRFTLPKPAGGQTISPRVPVQAQAV
ncbi:sensor histidine kinase [Alsobacter sp. R-9]